MERAAVCISQRVSLYGLRRSICAIVLEQSFVCVYCYTVFGCADMVTPFNATTVRDGDRLTVKCNRSEQIWYLVCVNNSWHGEPINCNSGMRVALRYTLLLTFTYLFIPIEQIRWRTSCLYWSVLCSCMIDWLLVVFNSQFNNFIDVSTMHSYLIAACCMLKTQTV